MRKRRLIAKDRRLVWRSVPRHPYTIHYAVETVPGRKADVIHTLIFAMLAGMRAQERARTERGDVGRVAARK